MYTAFLVLARCAGVVMVAPVFRAVPRSARLAVAVAVTAVVVPTLPAATLPLTLWSLVAALGAEVSLGFVLGGAVALALGALQLGMEIAGMQIGYASAAMFDPMSGTSSNPLTTLMTLLAGAIIVGADLHLALLVAVGETFQAAPAGVGMAPLAALPFWLTLLGEVLSLGVSLGGPFILVALAVQMLMALVMRVSPSMNIFFSVGHGLLLILGLMALMVCIPYILTAGVDLVASVVERVPVMVAP